MSTEELASFPLLQALKWDAIPQSPDTGAYSLPRHLEQMREAITKGNSCALASLLTSYEDVLDQSTRTPLACLAARKGQTECLRVILTHGIALDGQVTEFATMGGSLACLRLACGFGDILYKSLAHDAASRGHVDCLLYAMEHGCPVDDWAVKATAWEGYLKCVKVLVDRGLPRQPFKTPYFPPRGKFRPDQLRCLQHILDNGRSIHPSTLIVAARGGDLDTVRRLHTQGVHLWEGVREEAAGDEEVYMSMTASFIGPMQDYWLTSKIMAIPRTPEGAAHMWKPLLYGWANGAPVTPVMEEMFRAKRAATRATLLCFHVAARLSRWEGTSCEQRAAWAVMGHIPTVLVEKIIMHAEFEICDTLGCSLPRGCGVQQRVPLPPHVVWMRNGVVFVHNL